VDEHLQREALVLLQLLLRAVPVEPPKAPPRAVEPGEVLRSDKLPVEEFLRGRIAPEGDGILGTDGNTVTAPETRIRGFDFAGFAVLSDSDMSADADLHALSAAYARIRDEKGGLHVIAT
jgi:hypothetical protein